MVGATFVALEASLSLLLLFCQSFQISYLHGFCGVLGFVRIYYYPTVNVITGVVLILLVPWLTTTYDSTARTLMELWMGSQVYDYCKTTYRLRMR